MMSKTIMLCVRPTVCLYLSHGFFKMPQVFRDVFWGMYSNNIQSVVCASFLFFVNDGFAVSCNKKAHQKTYVFVTFKKYQVYNHRVSTMAVSRTTAYFTIVLFLPVPLFFLKVFQKLQQQKIFHDFVFFLIIFTACTFALFYRTPFFVVTHPPVCVSGVCCARVPVRMMREW